jgi:hypothetical protein
MEIKLTKSIITLIIIFVVGYIFIFISVIRQESEIDKFGHIKLKLESSNRELEAKSNEIKRLYSKISLLEETHNINDYKPLIKSSSTSNEVTNPISNDIITSTLSNTGYKPIRPGIIILGMHRSGTSVIGGLINKMGLNTGGPLIAAGKDNEKGFFERIDVVLENDELMKKQGVHYSWHTHKYDNLVGLKDAITGMNGNEFKEGKRGLAFLNNKANEPWMLKDPRLCLTLRTWLPLLNFIPAILFTYRHPMDVALSLNTRYEHFQIGKGLRLWYIYNRRAVEQSNDLCRVVASHKNVMSNPKIELDRIYNELIDCGVNVPNKVSDKDLLGFVDPKLQHGKTGVADHSCDQDLKTIALPDKFRTSEAMHIGLYRESMRVFCAFENGNAFKSSFKWDMTIQE